MVDPVYSKAAQIRRLLALGDSSKAEIAKELGCSRAYVYQIAQRDQRSSGQQILAELADLREDLRDLTTELKRITGKEDIIAMRLRAIN
jgi:predicted transcriptional regulator